MAKEEKLVDLAREHLDPDEEVRASALGAYETKRMGNDTVRQGVLIATQRRVVFYAKRLGGFDLESFPYKNISSFEAGKNLMGGTVSFFASSNKVTVKWIAPAASADVLVRVVRKIMEESPEIQPAPEAAVAAPDTAIEKIQKLAGLKDAGILTEEEFTAKKAQLLAEL